jgi:arsenite-transporting ATPase
MGVGLGSDPGQVVENLDGQQIDTQRQLDRYWGSIRRQLMDVLDWGGAGGIEAEEFLVFPGMDELFALLEVNRHARSGAYDVIVVDCAPTAETLRLLSLPEVLSWYFEKVLPTERRLMRAARPILSRLTDLPLPQDEVFTTAQSVFESIEGVKKLMADPAVTSARLVVNPEKMVIDEARRTYSYLGLFGYGVDGVVINRVLPEEVADPYFERWRAIQKGHLDTVEDAFAEVPRLRLRLFDDEMVGVDRLATCPTSCMATWTRSSTSRPPTPSASSMTTAGWPWRWISRSWTSRTSTSIATGTRSTSRSAPIAGPSSSPMPSIVVR